MQDNRLGTIGDTLPADFVHNLQIREYLASEIQEGSGVRIVGEEGCLGMTWRFGPLHFERYSSDAEPLITPVSYPRIIFWRPFTKTNIPKGWRRDWTASELIRQIGFARVHAPSYWESWESDAKRNRNRWLNQHEKFEIVSLDYETFVREYPKKGVYKKISGFALGNLERKIKQFDKDVHFFAARNREDGAIGAMVALVDMRLYGKAYYLAAFVKPEVAHARLAVGLIDHCFRFCVARNIQFLDFGCFWAPGNPSSWKGFSHFKQKFGVTLVRYPRTLWRFVRSGRD
jgi:hypothetical protein